LERIKMTKPISGEMSTVDVRVEAYDLRIDETDENLRAFEADPAGFMQSFLEQQGHKVNQIYFIRRNEMMPATGGERANDRPVAQRLPDRNYHITYPDIERSGWICCCA
jgi:hypothetical protein